MCVLPSGVCIEERLSLGVTEPAYRPPASAAASLTEEAGDLYCPEEGKVNEKKA
jgi:hypothetical protein